MSHAPKFGSSLPLVPAQEKCWEQFFLMNDAGLESTLLKNPYSIHYMSIFYY